MPNYKITCSGEDDCCFDGWDAALAEYGRLTREGKDPTLWMSHWCMVDVPPAVDDVRSPHEVGAVSDDA